MKLSPLLEFKLCLYFGCFEYIDNKSEINEQVYAIREGWAEVPKERGG